MRTIRNRQTALWPGLAPTPADAAQAQARALALQGSPSAGNALTQCFAQKGLVKGGGRRPSPLGPQRGYCPARLHMIGKHEYESVSRHAAHLAALQAVVH